MSNGYRERVFESFRLLRVRRAHKVFVMSLHVQVPATLFTLLLLVSMHSPTHTHPTLTALKACLRPEILLFAIDTDSVMTHRARFPFFIRNLDNGGMCIGSRGSRWWTPGSLACCEITHQFMHEFVSELWECDGWQSARSELGTQVPAVDHGHVHKMQENGEPPPVCLAPQSRACTILVVEVDTRHCTIILNACLRHWVQWGGSIGFQFAHGDTNSLHFAVSHGSGGCDVVLCSLFVSVAHSQQLWQLHVLLHFECVFWQSKLLCLPLHGIAHTRRNNGADCSQAVLVQRHEKGHASVVGVHRHYAVRVVVRRDQPLHHSGGQSLLRHHNTTNTQSNATLIRNKAHASKQAADQVQFKDSLPRSVQTLYHRTSRG